MIHKQIISITIASPRGFCAGVERAIFFVEQVLKKYTAPIYVHHSIVHNNYVVKTLEEKGVRFVSNINQVPKEYPIVFSAHGTDKKILQQAKEKNRIVFDAVCPLVSRIHRNVERAYKQGYHILFIGHKGHPEVTGTMSQVPTDSITLIEDTQQIKDLPNFDKPLTYSTQTTLSIADTELIVKTLMQRFPDIVPSSKMDICYATYNRQKAVMMMLPKVEKVLIIGSPESSNSKRLVEISKQNHVDTMLLDDPNDLDFSWIKNVQRLGISSGASAPESLVKNLIHTLKKHRHITNIETLEFTNEDVKFSIPKDLI